MAQRRSADAIKIGKDPKIKIQKTDDSEESKTKDPDESSAKGESSATSVSEVRNTRNRFQTKIFNDPIHGSIELHELLVRIIDTPQFQRLRNIKQLGGAYYVYPGASHNRFEHSIGVCHLAGELLKHIRQNQANLEAEIELVDITDKDILCVQIAGLCHDLGHGPFSHVFEKMFARDLIESMQTEDKKEYAKWRHEDISAGMFQHMLQVNELVDDFTRWDLNPTDITFIEEQIRGTKPAGGYNGREKAKWFLYEIVSNSRNGIDVDKWDYLARDSHHLGIKSSFDHKRFMKFALVLKNDDDNLFQICTRDKEARNLYDMYYVRDALHRRAYKHKSTILIEYLINEALKKENESKNFICGGKPFEDFIRAKENEKDWASYTLLTDNTALKILESSEKNLMEKRHQFKFLGVYKIGRYDNKRDKTEIASHITSNSTIPSAHLLVQTVNFNYGFNDKDPVENCRFYNKYDLKAEPIRKYKVSAMLPLVYSENNAMVYFRKNDAYTFDEARKQFKKYLENYCFQHEEFKAIVEDHELWLIERLDPNNEFLEQLVKHEFITADDKQEIKNCGSIMNQNKKLLSILKEERQHSAGYVKFVQCLKDSQQTSVAEIIEKGGIIAIPEALNNKEAELKVIDFLAKYIKEESQPGCKLTKDQKDFKDSLKKFEDSGITLIAVSNNCISFHWQCLGASALLQLYKWVKDGTLKEFIDQLTLALGALEKLYDSSPVQRLSSAVRNSFNDLLEVFKAENYSNNELRRRITKCKDKIEPCLKPEGHILNKLLRNGVISQEQKKEKSTDCDSALIPLLCVHG